MNCALISSSLSLWRSILWRMCDNIWAMTVVWRQEGRLSELLKLCTVIRTRRWVVLTVCWIGFCHTGIISLCIDLFVFIFVYFVCFCFILHSCCITVSAAGWTWWDWSLSLRNLSSFSTFNQSNLAVTVVRAATGTICEVIPWEPEAIGWLNSWGQVLSDEEWHC